MKTRTGRERRLVRRRLRQVILTERLVWDGPEEVMVRWERRGERTSSGCPAITSHTRLLNTTNITRLDSRRLGTSEAKIKLK